MADKLEGEAPSGQSRTATAKPAAPKKAPAKPKRKPETPTMTDDLTGKFLRVGNKLYRTSDDKKPIARLEPDRLKTSNIDALPDLVRLTKANGWTSIKIEGGDKFKRAAFLAAAAQGVDVKTIRHRKSYGLKPNACGPGSPNARRAAPRETRQPRRGHPPMRLNSAKPCPRSF